MIRASTIKIIEIAASIASVIFVCLWIYNPSGPYEPIITAAGIVFISAELFRRYGPSRVKNLTVQELTKDEVVNLARRLHETNFRKMPEKIKITSRVLRAKGRYNSSYGMKEIKGLICEAVASFIHDFERDLSNAGAPEEGVVTEILLNHSMEDTKYAASTLEEHFPTRVGSTYLNDVINAAIEDIVHQYQDASARLKFERRLRPTTSLESDAAN